MDGPCFKALPSCHSVLRQRRSRGAALLASPPLVTGRSCLGPSAGATPLRMAAAASPPPTAPATTTVQGGTGASLAPRCPRFGLPHAPHGGPWGDREDGQRPSPRPSPVLPFSILPAMGWPLTSSRPLPPHTSQDWRGASVRSPPARYGAQAILYSDMWGRLGMRRSPLQHSAV